jgi:hypothetical protein
VPFDKNQKYNIARNSNLKLKKHDFSLTFELQGQNLKGVKDMIVNKNFWSKPPLSITIRT